MNIPEAFAENRPHHFLSKVEVETSLDVSGTKMRFHVLLLFGFFSSAWCSLERCKRECSLPEGKGLCPLRNGPIQQIFHAQASSFDLSYRSIRFAYCNHSSYVATGRVISELPHSPSNLLVNRTLRLSSFSYFGRSIDGVYVDEGGLVGIGVSSVLSSFSDLRTSFWPNSVVCILCTNISYGSGSRVLYEMNDDRLTLSFAPSFDQSLAEPTFQMTFYALDNVIEMSWLNASVNGTVAVGLSDGIVPRWDSPLTFSDSLDFSTTIDCTPNSNCTEESGLVRPVGRTRPPATRQHPWTPAPPFNAHSQFCEFGCTKYHTTWSLDGCRAACDDFYGYDSTTGYSDRAEVARYECYDGCAIGNLRCQPGFFCSPREEAGIMDFCPPGKYRDDKDDYVTRCYDCPHGRYRETRGGKYMDACDKCQIGRYNQRSGSTSRDACVLCPPGRFANEPGMARCKCTDHFDGNFELTADGKVLYPECEPEDYLDTILRPEIESIDYSPRTTYP